MVAHRASCRPRFNYRIARHIALAFHQLLTRVVETTGGWELERALHIAANMSKLLVCVMAVSLPAIASAGTFDDPPIGDANLPFEPQVHVTGGFEMQGGDATTIAFRGHALVGGSSHDHHIPSLSLGLTLSDGVVQGDHDTTPLWTIGPEVMTDLDFSGVRPYLSLAAVRATMRSPDMGSEVTWGPRAGLGVNFGRAMYRVATSEHHGSYHKDDADEFIAMFALLLPQQFEINVERDAHANRVGFVVAYGI
jgi:hypothetical protein